MLLHKMLAAEEQYKAKEDELQEYLDNYESTHDYDEYHFELDEICSTVTIPKLWPLSRRRF